MPWDHGFITWFNLEVRHYGPKLKSLCGHVVVRSKNFVIGNHTQKDYEQSIIHIQKKTDLYGSANVSLGPWERKLLTVVLSLSLLILAPSSGLFRLTFTQGIGIKLRHIYRPYCLTSKQVVWPCGG